MKIFALEWREDGRCGNEFPLLNGRPAECNPEGGYYCCSEFGYCGSTEDHCNCPKCTDHRGIHSALFIKFSIPFILFGKESVILWRI